MSLAKFHPIHLLNMHPLSAKEMKAMLKHLITLRFHDKPDYHLLRTLLQDMKRRSKTELHIAPVLKTKPVIPHFKRQGYL